MNHLVLLIFRLLIALLLTNQAVIVQAEDYVIYQGMLNDYGGELSSRYQKRFSNSSEDIDEFVNIAEVGVRNIIMGYFWRPWFATWSGNNNVRLVQRWQQGDHFRQNSLTGILGQTQWQSNVFPVSRFPFRANVEYSRDDEEHDFQDELIERYLVDFNQLYTSDDNKTTMGANMSFNGRDSDINGESTEFRMRGNINHVYDLHNFSGNIEYLERENDQDEVRVDSLQKNDQLRIFARHLYNPNPLFSMENFSNLFMDNSEYERSSQESTYWQVNNNNFWRPEAEPRLRITSNTRFSDNHYENTNIGGTNVADLQQFNLYTGAFFDYSDSLTFDGNININVTHSDETVSANQQRIGAHYNPANFPLYSFDYNWYASANISNHYTEESRYQSVGGSIGQALTKDFFQLMNAPVILRITTQFTDELSNEKDFKERAELANRISLTHNYSNEGFFSNVQLSFEDIHGFGGEDIEFDYRQTGRLIISGNYQMGRHKRWSADMNLEIINEQLRNSESSLRYYGSGYAGYNDNRFFDVRGLVFDSTLTLSMEDVLSRHTIEQEQLYGDENLVTTTWENELTYLIGRLELNARFSISKSKSNTNGIIMFEAKRRFGYF